MLKIYSLQMLQVLEKALQKTLPESLKVYGTIFQINQRNPFKLQVLVDGWPNFNTVIIRPEGQEMIDDLDYYTNTYQIYSKNPKELQEVLDLPGIINWKQHLQIQASQSSLNEVIKNIAASRSLLVSRSEQLTYMPLGTVKKLLPSLFDEKKVVSFVTKPKNIYQEMFKETLMDVSHAELVNQLWKFGGTERSLKFIQRCIQHFPSICLLGPDGKPAAWVLMDQTGELRMAGTLPEYQGKGLMNYIVNKYTFNTDSFNLPLYYHVEKTNQTMTNVVLNANHVCIPCMWNQWKCEPMDASSVMRTTLGS